MQRLHPAPYRMAAVVAACWLAGLGAPLAAQRVPVDSRRLMLRADTFYIYNFLGRDTAYGGLAVDVLLSDGHSLTRIFDEQNAIFGRRVDTTVMRLDDLAPLSHVVVRRRAVTRLVYDDSVVRGWQVDVVRESTAVRVPLATPVYDAAGYDLVVRSAELAVGRRFELYLLDTGDRTVRLTRGAVIGSEIVDGEDCWLLLADFDPVPVRYWIDKATRALRRRELVLSPGEVGTLFVRHRRPRLGARGT